MIQIGIDETAGTRVLRVEGELSILNAGELQRALIAGGQPGSRTILDGAGITAIDLCGLQLLCSAHRTYRLRDAALDFGGMSETLRESVRRAGFEACRSDCPYRREGNCLWNW